MRTSIAVWLWVLAGVAYGQGEPSAAAVLMVEDEGRTRQAVTEPLGVALYGGMLRQGPYAEVVVVEGREGGLRRLAEALEDVAGRHEVIDVFLSVHTTRRRAETWAAALPTAAGRLRLVYSTACYGAEEERAAWEAVGAQTIVTHEGINDPVFALPWFLSRWLSGAEVGGVVEEGFRQTRLTHRFLTSLPGVPDDSLPDESGSRPVVTGDAELTIRRGLSPFLAAVVPSGLRYSTHTGGPLGLALRGLALEEFEVTGEDVATLSGQVFLPLALPPEVLDDVIRVTCRDPRSGELVLELERSVRVPMEGVELELESEVVLSAGRFDAERRELQVRSRGLWVRRGPLRVEVTELTVLPSRFGAGYDARVNVDVLGAVPIRLRFPIGGEDPEPLED